MPRQAVKLLLLDESDRLLLIHSRNSRTGEECWYPVGGGIEQGESLQTAAAREAYEETGLTNLPPGTRVWQRDHTYKYDNQQYDVHEEWLLHRVPHFTPAPAALTPYESQTIKGFHWWHATELTRTTATIFPPNLAPSSPTSSPTASPTTHWTSARDHTHYKTERPPDRLIRVRPARLDDSEQVGPLARSFATSFTPERAAFENTWPQLVDVPGTLLLVAESPDGRIVGYLLGYTHVTFLANGRVAWVEELMVDEAHRGAGVGRLLMEYAEHWAASENAAYVALASRRAGAFYLALGYEDSAVFFKKTFAT